MNSGDLKDPATAIPKGTLLAIGLTYFTYIFYGIVVAFTYVPAASGVVEEFNVWTNPNLTWEEKIQVSNSQIYHNAENRTYIVFKYVFVICSR
jgi:hypothetical protein